MSCQRLWHNIYIVFSFEVSTVVYDPLCCTNIIPAIVPLSHTRFTLINVVSDNLEVMNYVRTTHASIKPLLFTLTSPMYGRIVCNK